MQTIAAFVRLARPKFLLGGLAAYGLGTAIAGSEGRRVGLTSFVLGQTMVTAFQLMTHFANDYYDRFDDAQSRPTAFAGGSGVLTGGALAPRVALRAALACAAMGIVAALVFARIGNSVAALLGALIGVLAWSYSAPPIRLAARGWGELDTAVVVALLVPLAGFAAASGGVDTLALVGTAGPVCAMFAMMIGVEWPDHAADARTGKRNLVVRLGRRIAGNLAAVSAIVAGPALAAGVLYGAPPTVVPFAVLLFPLALAYARRIRRPASTAADIAAHGVTVFFVTVFFALLGYVIVPPR